MFKRFLIFLVLAILSVMILMAGHPLIWRVASDPLPVLDSIYEVHNITYKDTSEWSKISYNSNNGKIIQYRDLYENDSIQIIFTLTQTGSKDSTYIIQYFEFNK